MASGSPASTKESTVAPVDTVTLLSKSWQTALHGGLSGASAMGVQVLTLMWLRTTINYQYRYGKGTMEALRTLWKEGGVPRFYRGLIPALAQGPLSRFGDTFANTGVMYWMRNHEDAKNLPIFVQTAASSVAAGTFRIFLMPVDALKTTMQVEGKDALAKLGTKIRTHGARSLYAGALAASAATMVGHYPWFATYNFLDAKLPRARDTLERLMRSAAIGFCATAVSDTASNSIRVLKTFRQTSGENLSYMTCARRVIAADGWMGLFGRGLKTKIISNGVQGALFSVLWKYFERMLA